MFLLNSCLSLFSAAHFWAPLLPKLRGHFAEFLNNTSPAGLRILSSSPVSVYGTGTYGAIAAFLDSMYPDFATYISLPVTPLAYCADLPAQRSCAWPVFPFPASVNTPCPHSSDHMQYRNLHLLSIGYVFRPRLRPRLTQGRSALPWNPWIFGQ